MSYTEPVDRRMWGDAKFRALSKDAKLVWQYLMTGPHGVSRTPGLFRLHLAVLADDTSMSMDEATAAFAEVEASGMVVYDRTARVALLPNKLRYQAPANPNVVKGWLRALDEIPECDLVTAWRSGLASHLEADGKGSWLATETPPQTVPETVSGTVSKAPSKAPASAFETQDQDSGSGIRVQEQENEYPGVSDPPPSAAPAAQPGVTSLAVARSKQEALFDVWQTWATELEAKAVADDEPPGLATLYVEHLERAAGEYWGNRGGKFTPKRRADLAARLGRLPPHAQLFAVEQYVNGHRSKDERYCAAIAERLARLSDREFAFEVDTHRKANPNGIWSLVQDQAGVS